MPAGNRAALIRPLVTSTAFCFRLAFMLRVPILAPDPHRSVIGRLERQGTPGDVVAIILVGSSFQLEQRIVHSDAGFETRIDDARVEYGKR